MRYQPTEMAPHDTESHQGAVLQRRKAAAPPKNANANTTRKRHRASRSRDGSSPDDYKKRPRGRPRLESTDVTAQERRRTQIRLAQRAYRGRKETAIMDLQKEVEELNGKCSELLMAFQDLMAYFKAHCQKEHLTQVSHILSKYSFISIAPTNDGSSNDDGEPDYDFSLVPGAASAARRDSTSDDSEADHGALDPAVQSAHGSSNRAVQPARGALDLNVQPAHGALDLDVQPAEPNPQQWNNDMASRAPMTTGPHEIGYNRVLPDLLAAQMDAPVDYKIIAEPTSQNASFPANLPYDNSYMTNVWTPSPLATQLPGPNTFAWQETTFGRRLQRTALQRAAALLEMQYPPPDDMMRVFGFARMFENYDQIKKRTLAALAMTNKESLSYWQYPFHNIGGAGTHFPAHDMSFSNPTTNQTYSMPGRPMESKGYAMGPLDARSSHVRQSLLSFGQRIQMPGFDGEFFDCDEIEIFLRKKGVNIPSASRTVVVEVDDDAFDPGTQPTGAGTSQGFHEVHNSSTMSSSASMTAPSEMSSLTSPLTAHGSNVPHEQWQPDPAALAARTHSHQHNIDQLYDIFNPSTAVPRLPVFNPNLVTTNNFASPNFASPNFASPNFASPNFASPNFNPTFANPNFAGPNLASANFGYNDMSGGNAGFYVGMGSFGGAIPAHRKKVVYVDVEKLMHQLISRCTCLGRTPGFKPKDVRTAFWASVTDPMAAS